MRTASLLTNVPSGWSTPMRLGGRHLFSSGYELIRRDATNPETRSHSPMTVDIGVHRPPSSGDRVGDVNKDAEHATWTASGYARGPARPKHLHVDSTRSHPATRCTRNNSRTIRVPQVDLTAGRLQPTDSFSQAPSRPGPNLAFNRLFCFVSRSCHHHDPGVPAKHQRRQLRPKQLRLTTAKNGKTRNVSPEARSLKWSTSPANNVVAIYVGPTDNGAPSRPDRRRASGTHGPGQWLRLE